MALSQADLPGHCPAKALLPRFAGVAFVAVATDHSVRFVDQPLALGDAGAQLLLVVLELT